MSNAVDRHPRPQDVTDQERVEDEANARARSSLAFASLAAMISVFLAVVAVLAVAAVPHPDLVPDSRRAAATRSGVKLDALDATSRRMLSEIESGARQARALVPRQARVDDENRRRIAVRVHEIRSEIAQINGSAWRTDADVMRRERLQEELTRLAR